MSLTLTLNQKLAVITLTEEGMLKANKRLKAKLLEPNS